MRTVHGYQVTFDPTTGTHTWTAPNGRVYTVTLDDDLNLTADLDNPHPSAYRQPTLLDDTAAGPRPTSDEKTAGEARQAGDTTQALLDALIRKYGKPSTTDEGP
jgi:hypothetical protein